MLIQYIVIAFLLVAFVWLLLDYHIDRLEIEHFDRFWKEVPGGARRYDFAIANLRINFWWDMQQALQKIMAVSVALALLALG